MWTPLSSAWASLGRGLASVIVDRRTPSFAARQVMQPRNLVLLAVRPLAQDGAKNRFEAGAQFSSWLSAVHIHQGGSDV
jgi:hypothetical protein